MSLMIRIPLDVENMNALGGYFTDGPSMAAFYGLVSQLEQDAEFTADRFGLVVESYEARHSERLVTGLDAVPKNEQRDALSRPINGCRYANMKAALYLSVAPFEDETDSELLERLERHVNARRVQGGNLMEYISADKDQPVHIARIYASNTAEQAAFIKQHEKPLSTLYLSKHLPVALQGEALIDAFAAALMHKNTLMVCNGYIQVGAMQDAAGQTQNIGEPSYTLVEALPVHALGKLEYGEQIATLNRFFWSFDQQRHNENPALFLLS